MNNEVIVTASASGTVVNVSKNNPDYGYVRVEQTRMMINDEGWAEPKTVSALINGKVKDLQSFGLKAGDSMPGRIRVVERMEPFNPKNPDRDMKIAGDTGIVCSVGGAPIYRNCFYSENLELQDELVAHDNTEQIRTMIADLREADETADLS